MSFITRIFTGKTTGNQPDRKPDDQTRSVTEAVASKALSLAKQLPKLPSFAVRPVLTDEAVKQIFDSKEPKETTKPGDQASSFLAQAMNHMPEMPRISSVISSLATSIVGKPVITDEAFEQLVGAFKKMDQEKIQEIVGKYQLSSVVEKLLTQDEASAGNLEIVRVLVNAGFKPNENTLHFAVESGNSEILGFLLDMGLDPNAINNRNETPLYVASFYEDLPAVTMLLLHGAEVNPSFEEELRTGQLTEEQVKAIRKNDPLRGVLGSSIITDDGQKMLSDEQVAIATELLKYGANPNEVESSGLPLKMAREAGRSELVQLLLNKGAKEG